MNRTFISLVGVAAVLAACGQPAEPAPAASEAAPASSTASSGAPSDAAVKTGSGAGVVTGVDPAAGTLTINHEAIPAVGWPAMTMSFAAGPAVVQQVAVGDRIQFDLTVQGNAAEVTAIRPQ